MTVGRITRLVFVMGGVLVPRPGEVALKLLAPGQPTPPDVRLALYNLDHDLALGHIGADEYCRRAAEIAEVGGRAGDLLAALPGATSPLPGMPALVEEMSHRFELWLVSDYPRTWADDILRRSGLSTWFTADDVLILAEPTAPAAYPALFAMLISAGVVCPGSSLWIDSNPLRTSSAMRAGVDALIFVDAARTYREFGMQRLVPAMTYLPRP
jgi:beta-phosphoglucomutase-like phosphatase (HAD superfamily)